MDKKFSIEHTPRMEKAIRAIAKEDKTLFAEIVKKLEFFENQEFEKLDIAPIKRKHGKYKISEIKIKSPKSYRIFYFVIDNESKRVVFIDGKKKKVNAFKSSYYDILDKIIDNYEKN